MDVTDFQTQVIEASHEVPVVVDFWAEWCGPCQYLGPVIEQLAAEAAGEWTLAKVNTEDQQQVAMQYGIRSIPAVKMFHKGEVVGEFVGNLPRPQIEQWLAKHLPDPRGEELASLIEEVKAASGDALARLEAFSQANPDVSLAKVWLGRCKVLQDPQAARALVGGINAADKAHDFALDVQALADLMESAERTPEKLADLIAHSREALKAKDEEAAIQKLIEATVLNKNFDEELPRRACIALFHFWGDSHDLTKTYRRQFDMALY